MITEIKPMPTAIIIYDKNGAIRAFNDVAGEITAYDKSEVIGSDIDVFIDTINLSNTLASGRLYEIESKNGVSKIILIDLCEMNGPDGELLVLSFTDHTHYLEEHIKEQEEIHIDVNTGVYNCNAISTFIKSEAKRASRYKQPLAAVLIRIDNYDRLDSQYGEGKGDVVLQTLAIILKNETRDVDIVGRLTETIFVAVLPSTSRKAAEIVSNRIKRTAKNYSDEETPIEITNVIRVIDHFEEIDWCHEAVRMFE